MEIRNNFKNKNGEVSQSLIFGNGDVKDLADAKQNVLETGCDGVMLGRAIFGNPWLFASKGLTFGTPRQGLGEISIPEKLRVLVEHTKLFEEILPQKSFAIMKKHFKAYVTGWPLAKELRMKLMEAKDANQAGEIIEQYLKNGSK